MFDRVFRSACLSGTQSGIDNSSDQDESRATQGDASSSLVGFSNSSDEPAQEEPARVPQTLSRRRDATPDALAGWQSLLPEHRHYLMRNFIADARSSPQVQAISLRKLACVSLQNYFDVIETLNAKGFEAVSLCSTRFAVPSFLNFKEVDKRIKQKARLRIAEMVAFHGYAYIDLSHNWKSRPEQKGLRVAVTMGLLSARRNKWLRIDLSNYRFSSYRQGSAYPPLNAIEWNKLIQDQEGSPLVEALNKELARIAGHDLMPVFDLICQDQPLYSVVYPLVKQLAALSMDLPGLRSLNLNCLSMHDYISAGRQGEAETETRFAKLVNGLANIIANSPSLEVMGLRANGIGPRRVVTIARALQHNTVLERLDLSRNSLCSLASSDRKIIGGMLALKKALARNTKLARLDLSFCGIGDAGADELLAALKKNQTLECVDLTGNFISDEHAIFTDERVIDRARPAVDA